MIVQLLRRLRGSEPVYDFNGCEGFYVASFRPHMRRIAESLLPFTKTVSVYFDRKLKRVIFRGPDGIMAMLSIHGECCVAETAYVSPSDLSDYAKACFIRELATLKIRFVDLEQIPGYKKAA